MIDQSDENEFVFNFILFSKTKNKKDIKEDMQE